MSKKKRFVNVDVGYDLWEHYIEVEVIESSMVKNLWDDGLREQLLVELPGGERINVDYWEELTPEKHS